jgi:hypothetical protein
MDFLTASVSGGNQVIIPGKGLISSDSPDRGSLIVRFIATSDENEGDFWDKLLKVLFCFHLI